eukprot:889057_1
MKHSMEGIRCRLYLIRNGINFGLRVGRILKLKAGQQEKEQMVVKEEQKQRQGHKPQRSLLNELEGKNDGVSPPQLSNNDLIDIQGGVTLGSLPQDRPLEAQIVSPKVKYVFDNNADEEVFAATVN